MIIFLEARDEVLIRRFSETRHRHPLATSAASPASIADERELLEPVRAEADVVLDTSELSLRELRERIFARLGDGRGPDQLRSSSSASATSTACRSRPTSCSTSGS